MAELGLDSTTPRLSYAHLCRCAPDNVMILTSLFLGAKQTPVCGKSHERFGNSFEGSTVTVCFGDI
jgi:hypothetical protein